jgi:glucose-1-phosphate adenylyltransferase
MGADFYEVEARRKAVIDAGRIPVGIGEGVSIRRAIIDKNARIGAGAVIHGSDDRGDEDHDEWYVRDGILIVQKGAVIPPGSVL